MTIFKGFLKPNTLNILPPIILSRKEEKHNIDSFFTGDNYELSNIKPVDITSWQFLNILLLDSMDLSKKVPIPSIVPYHDLKNNDIKNINNFQLHFKYVPGIVKKDVKELAKKERILYFNTPSTPNELIDDLENIIRFSYFLNAFDESPYNKPNFYSDLLNSIDFDIFGLTSNKYLVYANWKIRQKFGMNILGKKCISILKCDACYMMTKESEQECPLVSKKKINPIGTESKEISIIDKKDDEYLAVITSYKVRDNTSQRHNEEFTAHVIRERTYSIMFERAQFEIMQETTFNKILEKVFTVFKNLGFSRARYYDLIYDKTIDPLDDDLNYNIFVGAKSFGMDNSSSKIESDEDFKGYRGKLKLFPYIINIIKKGAPQLIKYNEAKENPESTILLENLKLKDKTWLVLPLIAGEDYIGFLSVDSVDGLYSMDLDDIKNKYTYITPQREKALASFSSFLSHVIKNRINTFELDNLTKISGRGNKARDINEFRKAFVSEVCKSLNACDASIFELDESSNKIVNTHTYFNFKKFEQEETFFNNLFEKYQKYGNFEQYDADSNVTGRVFAEKELQNILDFDEYDGKIEPLNPKWKLNRSYLNRTVSFITEHFHKELTSKNLLPLIVRNALFVPIKTPERCLGVIRVANKNIDGRSAFTNYDTAFLERAAKQASPVLENFQLQDFLDESINKILKSLVEVREKGIRKEIAPQVAEMTVNILSKATNAKNCYVHLIDSNEKTLNLIAKSGNNSKEKNNLLDIVITHKLSRNIILYSFNKQIDIEYQNSEERNRYLNFDTRTPPFFNDSINSVLIYPLTYATKSIGVICITHEKVKAFSHRQTSILRMLSQFISLAFASIVQIQSHNQYINTLKHEAGAATAALVYMGENFSIRSGAKYPSRLQEKVEIDKKHVVWHTQSLLGESNRLSMLLTATERWNDVSKYNFRIYNIHRILHSSCRAVEYLGVNRYINIYLDIKIPYRTSLFLDEMIFKQAIHNILGNGVKYSKNNSDVSLCLKYENTASSYVIEVASEGVKIKPDERKLIFKEYYRGEEAIKYDSAGLGRGLYISKTIINNHNGKLEYMPSESLSKNIFRIFLPEYLEYSPPK